MTFACMARSLLETETAISRVKLLLYSTWQIYPDKEEGEIVILRWEYGQSSNVQVLCLQESLTMLRCLCLLLPRPVPSVAQGHAHVAWHLPPNPPVSYITLTNLRTCIEPFSTPRVSFIQRVLS